MKISPSALDVLAALLAVGVVSAFVPTSCITELDHIILSTQTLPTSTSSSTSTPTTCFASGVDIGETSASSVAFPYDDRQVRFAYDEWRLIYGKGDFDKERFEYFKTNHRTLTISNMNARENAAQQGLPLPQWMSLNDYGDYSLDEYEAMLRGEQPVVNDVYSMNYNNGQVEEYQDQFGRTIRSTQVLQQDSTTQDASSQTAYNSNYANNIDDADESSSSESRRTLIIPQEQGTALIAANDQVLDGGDEYYPQGGTQVISTNNGGATRGTQVVQPTDQGAANSASSTGTRVINKSMGDSNASYGTQVINGGNQSQNQNANTSYGTQVVRSGNSQSATTSYGTQVIKYSNPGPNANNARGTQVIQSFSGPGTRVIQPMNGDPSMTTTDGTQIIPRSDENQEDVRGSMVDRGTVVISKDDEKSWAKVLSPLFGGDDSEDNYNINDDTAVGSRGTMVIKRQIEVPEPKTSKSPFSFFGSSSTDEEKEDEQEEEVEEEPAVQEAKPSNSFFNFMSPKDNSTVAEETQTTIEEKEDVEKEKKSGGVFSFFGGNVKSATSRSVRTTITLQETAKAEKSSSSKKRKTKLIPEKQNENGMPSILSFFGGAKKVTEEDTARDPNARPTLIVKKPQKYQSQIWSPFSANKKTEESSEQESSTSPKNKNDIIAAQIAKQREGVELAAKRKAEVAEERETKRLEREQKRLEATQRRQAQARERAGKPPITPMTASAFSKTSTRGTRSVTPKPTTTSSPFTFFGAVGRQAASPTMKKWKQNRDGSITGLIYDSKSFKDGTRITTSPVPKGARKGTVAKTAAGSKYSLT